MRQLRSTLAQNASSHSTVAATSSLHRQVAVEAEGARQEVDAEVEPEAGVEQVLHLLVGLVAREVGVEVEHHLARRGQPEVAGDLGDHHLGDRSRGPCPAPRNLQT